MFLAFQTTYILPMVCFLLQMPLNNELRIKTFDGTPLHPTIHEHLVILSFSIAFSKIESHVSDSISLTSSWSTHLSKAAWSLDVVAPRKRASPLVCFQGSNQNEKE